MMSILIVAATLMGQPNVNPYGYYDYQIGPSGVMMTGNGWPPGYGLRYPFYGPYGPPNPLAVAQARQNLQNAALTSQLLQEQLWMLERQRNALQAQDQVNQAIEEQRQAVIGEIEERARLAKIAARKERDRKRRLAWSNQPDLSNRGKKPLKDQVQQQPKANPR